VPDADPALQFEPDLAVYRVAPGVELRDGIAAITAAIGTAVAGGACRLLIDLRAYAGSTPPGLGQRYALASDWARAAQGKLSIAVVSPPELIDPRRFGMQVALGAGLDGDVFDDEARARAWLATRPVASEAQP
jgi:hypothetical protein